MKTLKKCLFVFLVIVTIFTTFSVAMPVFASEIITENKNISETVSSKSDQKPVILGEVKELREENVKHYKLSDGTYKAVVYSSPVHYKEAGEWKDIDNRITADSTAKEKQYSASIDGVDFSFPDKLAKNERITINKEGKELSFGYIEEGFSLLSSSEIVSADKKISTESITTENNEISAVNSNILKYNNISGFTDIEYELNSTMLKESIVVPSKQNEYVYKFSFDIGNLTPVANDDGSILLIDKSNSDKLEYVITAPFMIDAKGLFSDSVTMAMTQSGDEYILTVTADKEWLNEENREFPVVIDPTILIKPDRINDIFDTYVDSATPTTNHYLSTYSIIGHNSLGTGRAYLKFNLPTLPHCGVIINATLGLIQMGYDPGNGVTNHMVVYESPSAQNYQTLTWSNQPSFTNHPIADYTAFQSGSNGSVFYALDITKIAKKWFEDGTNNGLFLASANESSSWRSTIYTSNYTGYDAYPMISVSYIDNVGLEDYWAYETVDLGRSGTAYINEYNGLLTYVHNDINLGGNITYLSASHIYSNDYAENGYPYGFGFRLSAQESITAITSTSSAYLYNEGYRAYLTDADGTAHYFKYVDSTTMKYEFDDNLILKTVTGQSYKYELQYEDGSKRRYDSSGRLLSIIDRNGNTITHTYNNGKISTITDATNRTVTFTYDANNYLTSMTDAAGRNTTYTYSGGYLQKITYPDGKTTEFTYSSKKLTNIKQTDSTNVSFTYKSSGRVGSVAAKGRNSSVLNTVSFNYKGASTIISDSKGRQITVGFDNMGRAVSYMDKDGNISTTKYNSGGNLNNTVAESSDVFSFADNMLLNHDFENNFNDWSHERTSGTSYLVTQTERYIGLKVLKMGVSSQGQIVVYQNVTDFDIGKEYTLSGSVKISAMSSGKTAIRIEGRNSSGTVVSSSTSDWLTAKNENWERIQVSYTVPSGVTTLRVCIELQGSSGTVFYDAMQLEEASSAGHYNLVINPGFERYSSGTFTSWTATGTVTSATNMVNTSAGAGISGSPSANARLMQSIVIGPTSTEKTLVFGAVAKGNCAASSNTENASAKFGILVELYNGSTLVTSKIASYNAYAIDTAQLISDSITASANVNKVNLYLLYDKNVNTAYFDNVFLYLDNFGTKYEYDTDGKITKQSNNAGDAISYTYDGIDIEKISVTKNGTEKDSVTYDYDDKHNILKETTKDGIITSYTYPSDNKGMPTSVVVENADGSLQSSNTYTYSNNYNYTRTVTDARGKTVSNGYVPKRDILTATTDANGITYVYSYNSLNDELIAVYTQNDDGHFQVDYAYDTNGQLSSISQDGLSYNFTYDTYGRRTATKVGSQNLATYSYNSKNLLGSTTYGNGTVHSLTYDDSDRVIGEAYDGTTAYTYSYNTEGYLGKTVDIGLGVTTYYDYDLVGRVTDVDSSNGVSSDFSYNEFNSIAGYSVSKNNTVISKADYAYNTAGLLTGVTTNNDTYSSFSYSYDGLNRLTSFSHGISGATVTTNYAYTAGTGSNTTGLVSSIGYLKGSSTLMPTLGYTYDNNGNISTVTKNGSTHITYTYDSLNRLVRENNRDINATVVYSYDDRGNILSQEFHDYTTGTVGTPYYTVNYTYDSTWKDKLTGFDGESITYDSIGNPTSYRSAALVWEKGRQLKSYTKSSQTISFKYDVEGLRTEKKVGSKTYSYVWSSGLLMQQTDGTNTLNFSYSPDGRPLAVDFDGTNYYYLYNLQGDVIGLYDTSGTVVVQYKYDSWGCLLSITGSKASTLGVLNPFRYRGYIYDTETELYYVGSRYYDPEIARWINADGQISSVGGDIRGYNLFSYCFNNPVNMSDPNGNWPSWSQVFTAVAVAAVAVAAVAVVVATAGAAAPALAVASGGMISSGIAATAGSIASAALATAAIATTAAIVTSVVENTNYQGPTRDQSVYVMRNKTTNDVQYVGRTNDPMRRDNEHAKDPTKADLKPLEVKFSGLTKLEARAMEQLLISAYSLDNLLNARREIARGNVVGFSEKIGNVISIFGGAVEDEFLNLMER